MKPSTSAVHYKAGVDQRVSKKTAIIVFASALALVVVLFAIAH